MMIICGYLIEFIILGIWYKWIVAKELNCKSIVRRSIKVFWAQRKNILWEGKKAMNKKNIFVRLETVYLNYLWNYVCLADTYFWYPFF